MKVATVFSGIGSLEFALKKMNIQHEVIFACDNGEIDLNISEEEISSKISLIKSDKERKNYIDKLYDTTGKVNYVKKSYLTNYKLKEDQYYQDARFLNGKNFKGKIDLLVGGSPCQSFSISGNHKGLDDTRGTLFYEYARLIDEIKPKVFIYENVPGILSNDKGKTWKKITEIFEELGYNWKMDILNSKDYGIPQDRKRVFVVGIKKDIKHNTFNFPIPIPLGIIAEELLEKEVEEKYYLREKGFKWVTNPKNLKRRVSINSRIIRTQAANQQFNWCGDMRFETSFKKTIKNSDDIYVSNFNGKTGVCRKLTPRECLRLMGYSDEFRIVVPDQKMYRQAGNSIVVNILESIIKEIIKTGVFYD